MPGNSFLPSLKIPEEQFVPLFYVSFGFLECNSVLRVVRHAHAEAVCLNAMICLSLLPGAVWVNVWEQTTAGVTRDDVGIDVGHELVVSRFGDLDTIEGFTVLLVGFASNGVTHSSSRHQVTFIAAVNKYLSGNLLSRFQPDLPDTRWRTGGHHSAAPSIETIRSNHLDRLLLDPLFIDLSSHTWFKRPHGVFSQTGC